MASPERGTPTGKPDPIRDLLDEKDLADEISRAIEGNDCPELAELEAYFKKELKEPERIEVKSHLTFCGQCRKKVEAIASGRHPEDESQEVKPRKRGIFQNSPHSRTRVLPALLGLAGLFLCGGLGYLLWSRTGGDFAFGGSVVYAEGKQVLRSGRPFLFEIRTPEPVFLIEITIDGEGRIVSRARAEGSLEGKFVNGERLPITPALPGEFDLYLVLCPASEGFNRLLNDLLKFLKTDTALSRENQRSGVEVALRLYQARYIHQVFRIDH